jgi:tetratricopeptide (TPR) repeat protein
MSNWKRWMSGIGLALALTVFCHQGITSYTLHLRKKSYEANLQNDYTQSALLIQRALKWRPKDLDLLADLAGVYFLQGRYEQAMEYYQLALAIDYYHSRSNQGIGDLYFLQKRYAEALPLYRLASIFNPQDEALKEMVEGVTKLVKLQEQVGFYEELAKERKNEQN